MEDWKDKVIGSIEGIERATPPADTFSKIQTKIAHQKSEEITVSRIHLAAVAAAVLIAVCTNIFVLSSSEDPAQASEIEQTEYTSILSNYSLYEL